MTQWSRSLIFCLAAAAVGAQEVPPQVPILTAVYTRAAYHTARRTTERDPFAAAAGSCAIAPADSSFTLNCQSPSPPKRRSGRRYYYSIVLFQDLNDTVYLAACYAGARESRCGDLKEGQTFPAEVQDRNIRIVMRGEQLPLRILETRPRPVSIDSPTSGTPSEVRPSAGTPSRAPYSNVPFTAGTPSNVRSSDVPPSPGSPSNVPLSQVSPSIASAFGARLYVYCDNGAAQVSVDGQVVGRPPLEIPLPPGRHTVVVQAHGYPSWVRQVDVPAGQTTRITADLRR